MSIFKDDRARLLKAVAVGSAVTIAVIAILMCLMSLALLLFDTIPFDLAPYILLAADAVAIFSGAYISAVIAGSRGMLTGALCGLTIFLIMLLTGYIGSGGELSVLSAMKLAVFLLFGVLGGIKGVNRKERLHIR